MVDQRSLRQDLFALLMCAVTVFLAISLLSYNPADPVGQLISPLDSLYQSDPLVLPVADGVSNSCGRLGAIAADMLYSGLGQGALYLVFSLLVLDIVLLRRKRVDWPGVRTAGWCISLAGITSLLMLIAPHYSPGPVIGSGGALGALGATILTTYFATTGGIILAGSLVLGGVLLATDYLLLRLVAGFARISWFVVGGLLQIVLGRSLASRQPALELARHDIDNETEIVSYTTHRELANEDDDFDDDNLLDDYENLDDQEDELLPVVVRGRSVDDQDQLADDAWQREESADSKQQRRPHFDVQHDPAPEQPERERIMDQLNEASKEDQLEDYELPSPELLQGADKLDLKKQAKEVRRHAAILEKTFSEFGFKVQVVEIETGPVIARYEIQLEAGLRLSRITGLADDLAIALRVPTVRIVAPIPGKNTVGIEVPNQQQQLVRLREVIDESASDIEKMQIPLFLGKDVSGAPLTVDLASMPHLLIAGRTGSGKSVCLHSLIASILMTKSPEEVRLLLIDPKMVELSCYGRLPHLMHPVVTDMKKAEAILAWAVEKMEQRYALLAQAGARHITSYNKLSEAEIIKRLGPESEEECREIPFRMPLIVIVADELADLMMTGGKEVERHIIRLAQKSRAVGIHLVLATQKPTVDVITGLIKSNLPARIAFQVSSRTDSRVVLDEMGAERLLGNGDMLFLWPGTSTLLRGQGTFLDEDEVSMLVEQVSSGDTQFIRELVDLKVAADGGGDVSQLRKRDDLYESAIEVVIREGRGSLSLLQRALGIGYGRAARLIDFMAEDGIVGQYNGSKSREVLMTMEEWDAIQAGQGSEQFANSAPDAPPSAPATQRSAYPDPQLPSASQQFDSLASHDDASSLAVATTPRRTSVEQQQQSEYEWQTEDGLVDELEQSLDDDDRLAEQDHDQTASPSADMDQQQLAETDWVEDEGTQQDQLSDDQQVDWDQQDDDDDDWLDDDTDD